MLICKEKGSEDKIHLDDGLTKGSLVQIQNICLRMLLYAKRLSGQVSLSPSEQAPANSVGKLFHLMDFKVRARGPVVLGQTKAPCWKMGQSPRGMTYFSNLASKKLYQMLDFFQK